MKQQQAVVVSNREIYSGVFLMWLQTKGGLSRTQAGQFYMVRCGGETILRRPISVHHIDRENKKIAFLYAVVGKGTKWLSSMATGDQLDILGPLGNGFKIPSNTRNLLLVAGGIGIAPLLFTAVENLTAGRKVTLLIGAAAADKLYPGKLLPKGLQVMIATDDGSSGRKGPVTALLPEYAPLADQIIACGPMPMLQFIAENRTKLGLRSKLVKISLEMRMGCGFGACLGCTVRTASGPKEVCKDGPVFLLEDIIWDDLTRV